MFPLGMVAVGIAMYPRREDTSFSGHTSKPLITNTNKVEAPKSEPEGSRPKGITKHDADGKDKAQNESSSHRKGSVRTYGSGRDIKYQATQIVARPGGDPGRTLPIGTSFIGKLLTGIDTRQPNSLVRVLAPYGGSFDHDRRIERNSVLFGTVGYPGQDEKIYLQFNRILFPDGREFRITAEALASSDYSPGIVCDENDGAGGRVATMMGLTMLSGVSDVLVEKESLGHSAFPIAKSNLRSGFFNGLTKATGEEAQRRAAKINGAKDYCTATAGSDLIVSLTETFKGEPL